MKNILIFTK
uniref:Uncharacterized protein n=1 Tax=Rhizophora mucronata TaxID=61149 RepID=A0A2P2IPW9_RHIMU